MKLVDILARELKVWPEGCSHIVQDHDGQCWPSAGDISASKIVYGKEWSTDDDGVLEFYSEIASDFGSAKVTRAEWQAAVDALNAPKVVEWDGVGDPPAMSKIEYKSVGGTWKKGVFVGRVYGKIVAGCDETEVVGWLPLDEMRPIRTAEQVAAEERNKVIREMVAEVTEEPRARHFAFCEALYDAGYRKEPKRCGS